MRVGTKVAAFSGLTSRRRFAVSPEFDVGPPYGRRQHTEVDLCRNIRVIRLVVLQQQLLDLAGKHPVLWQVPPGIGKKVGQVDGGIVQQRIGEVGDGKPLEVSLDGMEVAQLWVAVYQLPTLMQSTLQLLELRSPTCCIEFRGLLCDDVDFLPQPGALQVVWIIPLRHKLEYYLSERMFVQQREEGSDGAHRGCPVAAA